MISYVYINLKNRRSVRDFLPKPVNEKVIERILDAARWAPSAHNSQPWRFILVNDLKVKKELAEAMAKEWNKDLIKDGLSFVGREHLLKQSIKQIIKAPEIVVACLTMEDMDVYPDKRRQKAEYTLAVQSVAAAIQTLLLAAFTEGLGTCWLCAPLFCQKKVKKVLKLPQSFVPQGLILIGFPDKIPRAPSRKLLKSIVSINYWGFF